VFHAAPLSLVATRNPRTSRRPSALPPVAINTTALISKQDDQTKDFPAQTGSQMRSPLVS
jgi:hypothetical protein